MAMTQTVLYVFSQLGALLVPTVWHHLESQGVHHSMYATSWFMTLFASSFPFELVTRIFDIFLLEGQKIIYRVSLALLKVCNCIMYIYICMYINICNCYVCFYTCMYITSLYTHTYIILQLEIVIYILNHK
jgi:hypothetical protein